MIDPVPAEDEHGRLPVGLPNPAHAAEWSAPGRGSAGAIVVAEIDRRIEPASPFSAAESRWSF